MAVFGSLQFTTTAADDSKITNESLSCLVGWACVALVEEGVKWAFLKEEMRSPPSFNNFCWLIIAQEKNDDDADDVNQQ